MLDFLKKPWTANFTTLDLFLMTGVVVVGVAAWVQILHVGEEIVETVVDAAA